ncbi:MAG: hypothetical protein NZ455_09775 [Bacteroidia bacterium]|nr:hypothetical protein [Bacteroidia bacterium]MDW8345579.1 hypothetical protein [Bacteroidia bacterium]
MSVAKRPQGHAQETELSLYYTLLELEYKSDNFFLKSFSLEL